MRRIGLKFGVCGIIALGLASGRASAQVNSVAPVKLDYREGARCGSADAFIAEVRARSPRVRFTGSDSTESARSLVVHIEPRGARMAGRVELRESDGTTTERAVTGASCDDVVSALGLVSALALDPLASTSATNTNNTNTNNTNNTTNDNTANANNTNTNDTSTHTNSPSSNAANESRGDGRWLVGAGANVEAVIGVSPDPMFAVPVFVEVGRLISEHLAITGGVRFVRTGDASTQADFTWTAGALDVCVVWRTGRFGLHACARSYFGALDVHGEGVTPERSAVRPWVDVSGVATFRGRIVGPLFIEASASIGVALVQDRFYIEPNQTVFQASVTAHVGGGLGFEIW